MSVLRADKTAAEELSYLFLSRQMLNWGHFHSRRKYGPTEKQLTFLLKGMAYCCWFSPFHLILTSFLFSLQFYNKIMCSVLAVTSELHFQIVVVIVKSKFCSAKMLLNCKWENCPGKQWTPWLSCQNLTNPKLTYWRKLKYITIKSY